MFFFFFLARYDWLHGINVKPGLHTSLHTNPKLCNILPRSVLSRFSTLELVPFPFLPRGEREQISRKTIPSDVVIARKSNLVKETNRRVYQTYKYHFSFSCINLRNHEIYYLHRRSIFLDIFLWLRYNNFHDHDHASYNEIDIKMQFRRGC